MRVVCYYLRVSLNRNAMLLVKLKDTPSVEDGDRMLCENGIYYRVWEADLCGAFRKIGHWNQLNVFCGNGHGECYLECDGCISVCEAQTGVFLLSEHCVN